MFSPHRLVRPTTALAAFAATALILAGCTSGPQRGDPAVSSVPVEVASPTASASTDAVATGDDAAFAAIATAEAETGGIAYEIDFDDDLWEVHVAVGDTDTEVRTTADGATVRSTDTDDSVDSDDRAALDAAGITIVEALQAAIAEYGASTVEEITVTDDIDSQIAWEVSFADDTEVVVNVVDGTILRVDR